MGFVSTNDFVVSNGKKKTNFPHRRRNPCETTYQQSLPLMHKIGGKICRYVDGLGI